MLYTPTGKEHAYAVLKSLETTVHEDPLDTVPSMSRNTKDLAAVMYALETECKVPNAKYWAEVLEDIHSLYSVQTAENQRGFSNIIKQVQIHIKTLEQSIKAWIVTHTINCTLATRPVPVNAVLSYVLRVHCAIKVYTYKIQRLVQTVEQMREELTSWLSKNPSDREDTIAQLTMYRADSDTLWKHFTDTMQQRIDKELEK